MKNSYFLVLFTLVLFANYSFAQLTIPYVFENSSRYGDDEIYIGLVGKTAELGDVWMNMKDSELQVMSADDNTIPGPDFSFPKEWLYPDVFVKLSDINNNTIQIPQGLFACRIFISFESPMYLHFHETGGYAGANLNNPGDPNDGIRWEIVELTWGDAGLWTNTSRVDAYQYPMALEVTGYTGGVTGVTYEASYNDAISGAGTPQFKRIGEVLPHDEILAAWDNMVSDPYKVAKVIKDNSIDGEPIIEQPSKIAEFTDDILDDYIDDIWETYKNFDLNINIGDRGTWIGRVQADDTFLFTDPADGSIATIHGRPTTINAMEGSGFLAYTPTLASENLEKHDEDLMIQAQMAASITRHAIYTNITEGTVQFTHDADRFFVMEPFNEYVEFFHNEAISFESQTYAFAYDDVGDHSSTIQTTFPTDVKVIIGGYGETPSPIVVIDSDNLALNGTASQSSTYNNGVASNAIDGNTSGVLSEGSVTHTNSETNAWWQVDLGSTENIGVINIFNRTDSCCVDRLGNFTVSVINSNGTTTFSQSYTTAPDSSINLNANGASGQIIRVELDDTNYLSLAEVEVYEYEEEEVKPITNFIPDTDKTYYIDIPVHDLRLAATGNSEEPYTTATTTTGNDVEWQFVAKGNGSWHVQLAAGGTFTRLGSDNSANADMQETSSNGTSTYFDFEEGSTTGTYFITLPDGPTDYLRLQVNNLGEVKMVSAASNQTWESFTFTEVTNDTPSGSSLFIEAEYFTAMSGVQLEDTNDINGGQNVGYIDSGDWMEYTITVPTAGTYTLNARVASPNDGAKAIVEVDNDTVSTIQAVNTTDWQIWETVSSTISLSAGTQTLRITSNGDGFNFNWFEIDIENTAAKNVFDNELVQISVYPNPAVNQVNISIPSNIDYSSYDVIDLNGKVLINNNISNAVTPVTVDQLNHGLYLIRIYKNGNISQVLKFIK